MKRFEIITESDARVLSAASTVMLAQRRPCHAAGAGHAARAAHHGRARRARVARTTQSLVPRGRHPDRSRSPATTPASRCGRRSSRSCAAAAWRSTTSAPTAPIRWTIRTSPRRSADAVARGEADAGIVIDGAGIGSAIAANKIAGHPRGDGDDRDDRAVLARAQRRERADARRHARQRRRGARDRRRPG